MIVASKILCVIGAIIVCIAIYKEVKFQNKISQLIEKHKTNACKHENQTTKVVDTFAMYERVDHVCVDCGKIVKQQLEW